MTVGQAIEQADELRPNNQFTDSLKQSWLHQCDARMRTSIVSAAGRRTLMLWVRM